MIFKLSFNVSKCIKHRPGDSQGKSSSKLIYPSTQTGFPFNGNLNNPGSSISGVMRCVNKIQNVRKGSLETIIYQEKYINNLGCNSGNYLIYRSSPRNTF